MESVGDYKLKDFGHNIGKWIDCSLKNHREILDKASPHNPMKGEGERYAQMVLFNEHLVINLGIISRSDTKENIYHRRLCRKHSPNLD
jgi:hypothetical protein